MTSGTHGSAPSSAWLALVVLLVAVAVASTGSVPAGTGGARSPSDRLLDVADQPVPRLDGRSEPS